MSFRIKFSENMARQLTEPKETFTTKKKAERWGVQKYGSGTFMEFGNGIVGGWAVIPGKHKFNPKGFGSWEQTKGKGWREAPDTSGKAPIHKKVAERAQAKHAQNTPMKKTPTYKPPYRVDVWEERDRLIITVYDANDKEVASWVDDDARQMFVDGFFDSKDLEQSVLEYLRNVKIIKGG